MPICVSSICQGIKGTFKCTWTHHIWGHMLVMHENTQYRLYIGESCRTRGNTPQCGNFLNSRDFSQLMKILHQPSFQVISYLALWYDPVYINISIQIYFPVYRNISVPGHYPVPPPHDWKRFSWNARKLSNWCFQSTIYFVLHSLNWIFHSFSVSDISSVDNKKAFLVKQMKMEF